MANCKICGLNAKLENGKCGFCQREHGIPGGDRIKQAIKELPEDMFGLEQVNNVLPYYFSYNVKLLSRMEQIGFLEVIHGSHKRYKLTDKAMKYIEIVEKKTGEGSGKLAKKTPLLEIRGERVLELLEKGGEYNKRHIRDYLREYEDVTSQVAYQAVTPLVKDGTVEVRVIDKTNWYSLPGATEKPEQDFTVEEEKAIPVIETEGTAEYEPKTTIGQILDILWPYTTTADCKKNVGLKNATSQDHIIARFKDQKTLLKVFHMLPPKIQNETRMTIQSKTDTARLNIPII
jgi:hypothetical protein